MHRGVLAAAIVLVISLHGIQRGEAGQIIDLDFTSGTATPLPPIGGISGIEFQQYIEDGVVVTAIPAAHHGGCSCNPGSFHLLPLGTAGLPGGVLHVFGQDRGAPEFSLGGQPFDLLSADFDSVVRSSAVLDGFVGDTLRISAVFPGTWEEDSPGHLPGVGGTPLPTFQFSDPAWRGITSFVFDTTGSGLGSSIDNVRLHVSLPPNWILGAVGSLMAMTLRHGS